ncbi:MAG TPA: hypothetical protein VE980_04575 [Pyrinomonadaceae bacterium]|nr:hypothetical protein [Pyrinomonadaceae bacterium]
MVPMLGPVPYSREKNDYSTGLHFAFNLVSGDLDGTENQFFHQVSVTGPGTVTFTFSVKAKDPKAGANFTVTDLKGKFILTGFAVQVVDGGSQTVSKTVTLANAQRIIILGQGIKPADNGGHGTYSVQLSGPATFVK